MADDIQNNWGAQAIDTEQNARRWQYNVHDGCTVTVGTNAMEVDVSSGTVTVAGTRHNVGAVTVTLSSSQSDPRKDVVYVDSSGSVQVAQGTAAPEQPAGQTGRDTYQPLPPDLSQMDATPLAEIWVGAGVSDITSSDISDRRQFADITANNADVKSLSTEQQSVGGQPQISYWPPVYQDPAQPLFTDSPATSYTDVSLTSLPDDATHAIIRTWVSGDGSSDISRVRLRKNGSAVSWHHEARGWAGHQVADGSEQGTVPVDANNKIEYTTTNAASVSIAVVGYY